VNLNLDVEDPNRFKTTKITKDTKKMEEIVLKPFVNFVPSWWENFLQANIQK